MTEADILRSVVKIQCGGCQKYFAGTWLFDKHRVGPYEHRRCMTTEEMQVAGMEWEHRMVNAIRENKRSREKHEVWCDPAAREKMRSVVFSPDSEKSSNDNEAV